MKKKNSWVYFIVVIILINIFADLIPINWGDFSRLGMLLPFGSMIAFFLIVKYFAQNQAKATGAKPVEKPEQPKQEEETSLVQELYDDDSFKIDPDDFKF